MTGWLARSHTPPDHPWHVSWVTYCYLRHRLEQLHREAAAASSDADYWYLRARYTEAELADMYYAASAGYDLPAHHPGHPDQLERTRAWAARGDERKERTYA